MNRVDELLLVNGNTFHLKVMKKTLSKWNGIVERDHCIIKAMVERGDVSPTEAVFSFICGPALCYKE